MPVEGVKLLVGRFWVGDLTDWEREHLKDNGGGRRCTFCKLQAGLLRVMKSDSRG